MLRKLVFLTALLTSTVANAENWQLVEDATNGLRLVVDVDSVRVQSYTKEGGVASMAVTAKMSYITQDNEPLVFLSGIDGNDCVYQGGGSIVNVYADRSESNYFWSFKGGKIYDAQGQWLCAYLIDYVEKADKKTKKKPAVKQNSRPKVKV